ncbi:hypothetical protein, partial [Leucobacter celer]|uniref:hypothetical protein n=1 Tax=Leucobacter celer TaxID=668625 RepID=UPI000B1591C9
MSIRRGHFTADLIEASAFSKGWRTAATAGAVGRQPDNIVGVSDISLSFKQGRGQERPVLDDIS